MREIVESVGIAMSMLGEPGSPVWSVVRLSLGVSATATLCAAALALPAAAWIAAHRFPGRAAVVVALNALMGLPAVVVGLLVYLLLSRAGPLGAAGLLFTPGAMIVAQAVLVAPLIAALARQTLEDSLSECGPYLRSLRLGSGRIVATLLWEARLSLIVVLLAGFGRAAAEVGAVMIVGGNIDGVTRVMTTAIALETSKGDLPLAMALGFVLLAVVFTVNAAAALVRQLAWGRLG